jgi:hypothetical protein
LSYHRRVRKRIAQQHEFYEAPSGNEYAMGGETDLDYGAAFPGPRETRFVDAANRTMPLQQLAVGDIEDAVEWDIGGVSGATKFVGSEGVTDPATVDAHSFLGEMAVIRRMPDTNYGPVAGGEDNNALLSLLYSMQETNHFFPNEVSQADIIKAV